MLKAIHPSEYYFSCRFTLQLLNNVSTTTNSNKYSSFTNHRCLYIEIHPPGGWLYFCLSMTQVVGTGKIWRRFPRYEGNGSERKLCRNRTGGQLGKRGKLESHPTSRTDLNWTLMKRRLHPRLIAIKPTFLFLFLRRKEWYLRKSSVNASSLYFRLV